MYSCNVVEFFVVESIKVRVGRVYFVSDVMWLEWNKFLL